MDGARELLDGNLADHPRVRYAIVEIRTSLIEGDRGGLTAIDVARVPSPVLFGRGVHNRAIVLPGERRADRDRDTHRRERIVLGIDGAVEALVIADGTWILQNVADLLWRTSQGH